MPKLKFDDFFLPCTTLPSINDYFSQPQAKHLQSSGKMFAAMAASSYEAGPKVTSIQESVDMSTLTLDSLYKKLKIHEMNILSRKVDPKSSALFLPLLLWMLVLLHRVLLFLLCLMPCSMSNSNSSRRRTWFCYLTKFLEL